MGKLASFVAMKRDLAFEYETELRGVRNAMLGIARISGSEHTIDLTPSDSFVAESKAKAGFLAAFKQASHAVLLKYAGDLAKECLELGLDQEMIGSALGGAAVSRSELEPGIRLVI